MENEEKDFDELEEVEEVEEQKEVNWEAEAKKHKAIAERLKKKLETPLQEKKVPTKPDVDVSKILEEQDERVDLRLQNYSKQEIDFADRNREQGQSLSDAIKSDFVAAGIEALRQKQKAEDGTQQPSNKNTLYQGKTFAQVVAGDSEEDKKAAFEALVRKKALNQSE